MLLAVGFLSLSTSNAWASNGQWPSWGGGLDNSHFSQQEKKIKPENVSNLQVKWTYDMGVVTDMSAIPVLVGGTLYFPDWAGNMHAVDADTGAQVWKKSFASDYSPAGGNLILVSRNSPAVFGDLLIMGSQVDFNAFNLTGAVVIAVNRHTGDLVWSTKVDDHFASIVTTSPVVYGNDVFLGVASQEELLASLLPGYDCCTFIGSVVKLNAVTGAVEAKRYMAPGAVEPWYLRDPNGYSGNAVWGSQLSVDLKRKQVYVATGNNYDAPADVLACEKQKLEGSLPADHVCDAADNYFDSFLALSTKDLKVKWGTKLSGFDTWNVACGVPGLPFPNENPGNCPDPAGPDYDFAQAPMIITAKINKKKTTLVVAGQKSGWVWAVNADNGALVWSANTGVGGLTGGAQWGAAADDERIYVPNANSGLATVNLVNPSPGSASSTNSGFWTALDPATGAIIWQSADPLPLSIDTSPATVANGVLYVSSNSTFTGTGLSGAFRALDAATGEILWTFDLGTVNGLPVLANGAPTVIRGTVYWGAGYGRFGGAGSTNLFYAFELPHKSHGDGSEDDDDHEDGEHSGQ